MLEPNKIYCGDCLEIMKDIDNNSIDAIITDPPYELGFMGKHWDTSGITYNINLWKEALRVLKPGSCLLSFGGSRTYHRMACAIEDAGFEIRDMIEWMYGSGFPKSLNIGKAIDKLQGNEREVSGKKDGTYADIKRDKETGQDGLHGGVATERPRIEVFETKGTSAFEGWGTALKPAHEPICMARKPLSEKTVAENVLKYGTGGINIDECRIGTEEIITTHSRSSESAISKGKYGDSKEQETYQKIGQSLGRFPANLIHDGSDEVVKLFPDSKGQQGDVRGTEPSHTGQKGIYGNFTRVTAIPKRNDSGSAARFFYCAKASKTERNKGLTEGTGSNTYNRKCLNCDKWERKQGLSDDYTCHCKEPKWEKPKGNFHPTVKPIKLMEYLVKLVTVEGAVVLDHFCGTGSTLIACRNLGRNYIGIDNEAAYVDIANKRLANTYRQMELIK